VIIDIIKMARKRGKSECASICAEAYRQIAESEKRIRKKGEITP